MRKKLETGTLIWFDPAEDGSFRHWLRIRELIGEGGTGMIYTAEDEQGIPWVVKESFPNTENSVFCPVRAERKDDGTITLSADSGYDLIREANRILENESEMALSLQNDLNNQIMNMPFYTGMLKGAALQCPGQSVPTACTQVFSRMQYIKGVTADKAVFADIPERLRTVQEILQTVAGIHRAGLLLGDIKPQNIMITEGGHCYLLDYGSAVKTDAEGKAEVDPSTWPHSSGYVAPEFFDPTGEKVFLTKGYDVYSLGALLMDLLLPERTGMIRKVQYRRRSETSHPFLFTDLEKYGAFNTLSIRQELPLSPALADQLSGILRKSLADERKERYADAGELLQDYTSFLKNYQYRTISPQEYDPHLLWQFSYDLLAERLEDTLEHRIAGILDSRAPMQTTPEWWKLQPVKALDADGNVYAEASEIIELLKIGPVYLYAPGGRGKTLKACQIMRRCLRQLPVLYVDLGLLDSAEGLSAEKILTQALRGPSGSKELSRLLIEGLRKNGDHFLIVLDSSDHIAPALRDDMFRAIAALRMEFRGAALLLIGRKEMIGDRDLDACFRKIRLELLEGEIPLLQIPFFYMLYQKSVFRDPAFALDTGSEVRFLETYLDSLGSAYYKYEKLLQEIAAAMTDRSFYGERMIRQLRLLKILTGDHSFSEAMKIIDILTDKLGLLVPVQVYDLFGADGYAFVHDIYQEYFAAGWLRSMIEGSLRLNRLDLFPASGSYAFDPDTMRMLMASLDRQKLEKFYALLSTVDSENTAYNGIIRSFADHSRIYENCMVSRWTELGVKHKDDHCMAVAAADLIIRSAEDRSLLDRAVRLCQQQIDRGSSGWGDWAGKYLGMLILHDDNEKLGYRSYIDRETFTAVVASYPLEDIGGRPQRFVRIKGPIGKIGDYTTDDGMVFYFGYVVTALKTLIALRNEE